MTIKKLLKQEKYVWAKMWWKVIIFALIFSVLKTEGYEFWSYVFLVIPGIEIGYYKRKFEENDK